jgi:hypothetical protein
MPSPKILVGIAGADLRIEQIATSSVCEKMSFTHFTNFGPSRLLLAVLVLCVVCSWGQPCEYPQCRWEHGLQLTVPVHFPAGWKDYPLPGTKDDQSTPGDPRSRAYHTSCRRLPECDVCGVRARCQGPPDVPHGVNIACGPCPERYRYPRLSWILWLPGGRPLFRWLRAQAFVQNYKGPVLWPNWRPTFPDV